MTPPEDPERGAALLIAMLFGALSMALAMSLAGRFVVEYRQVEDSLAQVRAYWAARGTVSYVLSRTMAGGACAAGANCSSQGGYVAPAVGYLNEIKDLQTWSYPDVSPYYNFNLVTTVNADPLAPSGRLGEVEIKTAFAAAPAPPPVAGAPPPPPGGYVLDSRRSFVDTTIRPVDLRYCVVQTQTSGCGGGNQATSAPYWQRITSVHRPAS